VNIDITPRTHHDDEVSLALKVTLSNVSGSLNGLPTFGNREITTTIRLKDGETNMLAGLIRDEERTVMTGLPGLSDLPLIGRLFANNRKEAHESDIVLTLTPHIVRVLDLTEADLRPFRLGRDVGSPVAEPPAPPGPPRDQPPAAGPGQPPAPAFPQPLEGKLPGVAIPNTPPPPKKGGGG
jgi:general secretion pathway protein D